MRTVDAVPRSRGTNILSKTDTNDTLRIRFPVKAWLDAYPDCVIQVIHRRSQDPDGLPAAVLETDGVYAYWLITDSDTAYEGDGEAELRMQSGTAVSKSETYDTHVVKSVGSSEGPAPEPVERVAEQIAASAAEAVSARNIAVGAAETAVKAKNESVTAANRAEDAAEAAETASTHGPTISEDGTWLVWDAEQGQYVDTGIQAEGHDGQDGQDGADGISPEVTFSVIEGGHSMTVTDREHPDGQTINIMDGEDAEVPIDDTEPAANKVYSSAKFEQVVGSLNQAILNLDTVKADKIALKEANRRIHLLEEAALGHLYTDETVSETSYQQTVPSGSLSNAVVGMLGGHSEVVEGEIVSADTNAFEVAGRNLFNGTDVYNGSANMYAFYTNGIELESGTYSAIYCENNAPKSISGVYVMNKDTSEQIGVSYNKSFYTFTLATKTKIYVNCYGTAAGAIDADYSKRQFMLIRGSVVPTVYIPYVSHSYPIPASVLSQYPLRSAGSAFDTITYEPQTVDGVTVPVWKHHKRAGTKDLGTLTWTHAWTNAFYSDDVEDGKPSSRVGENANVTFQNYVVGNPSLANVGTGNYWLSSGGSRLGVCTGDYDTFPTGVMLYELATPIVTDITDLMQNWDGILEVEEGGTVTFCQVGDTVFAIPNTVNYLVRTTGGA